MKNTIYNYQKYYDYSDKHGLCSMCYDQNVHDDLNTRTGFHVFGHSWGTIVATLYAASNPPGDYDDKSPPWQ